MNTRINLQPIAAPSILGLYAFAGSTLIVAANMAGWYGGAHTALYLIPFTTVLAGSLSSQRECGPTKPATRSLPPCTERGVRSGSASASSNCC
jgi:hypothetical protein